MTPPWLSALVTGAGVLAAPLGEWRLFEVGCDDEVSFARAHIPGAGYLEPQRLEEGPLWKKDADAVLLQVLLDHGIRHDTTVVLYGRNTLAAARAAHFMLYAGVEDVRLLGWRLQRLAGGGLSGGLRPAAALRGCGWFSARAFPPVLTTSRRHAPDAAIVAAARRRAGEHPLAQ